MHESIWLGIVGLLAAVAISWVICRLDPVALESNQEITFLDVCGSMAACWAVLSTTSTLSSLAKASDGRYWIFNNESPARSTYADGIDMNMVREPNADFAQNHTMSEAHQCFITRCDAPLSTCGTSPACRGAWVSLLDNLSSLVDVARLRPEDILREDTRDLATCFFSRCLCMADLATGEDRTAGDAHANAHSKHVARFPGAIDDDDVQAILSLAESIAHNHSFVEDRSFGAVARGEPRPVGGQRVTYLQSRFRTDDRTASLYARVRELVIRADAQNGWRRVHPPTLVPRTIELLSYTSRSDAESKEGKVAFSLGWHIDEESALTALLLLSDPASYSGGELYHIANGETHAARARQHELLVYRSHTPHAVGAITQGTRLAVALEFWHVHAPGEGVEHPWYPFRRIGLLPRKSISAPDMTTLGRCPK